MILFVYELQRKIQICVVASLQVVGVQDLG
jgi:hypothetical protein